MLPPAPRHLHESHGTQIRSRIGSAELPPLWLQEFEDTLDKWMAEFHTILTFDAVVIAPAPCTPPPPCCLRACCAPGLPGYVASVAQVVGTLRPVRRRDISREDAKPADACTWMHSAVQPLPMGGEGDGEGGRGGGGAACCAVHCIAEKLSSKRKTWHWSERIRAVIFLQISMKLMLQLQIPPPQLPPYADEKETELDAAKAAVAANTNLFMELNEEEFAQYLQTFVQDVWVLLTKVSLLPRQVWRCHCHSSPARAPSAACLPGSPAPAAQQTCLTAPVLRDWRLPTV